MCPLVAWFFSVSQTRKSDSSDPHVCKKPHSLADNVKSQKRRILHWIDPIKPRMSSRIAVQKLLEEYGLKKDEDFFLRHSVRNLVSIDIAVQQGEQRIAFMKNLTENASRKLALLGWRPVNIPPENLVTRQWVNAILQESPLPKKEETDSEDKAPPPL
jgi:tRNA U38,U39,U40 pseudouridine synthase TruA